MAYTFTHPIRYYKANDPYYYEVDNIPLRQLEENVLYLKDIVSGDSNLGGILTTKSEIDLKNIKQLRPTREGSRGIKVNAGWFNARINDAYSISEPLLKLLNSEDPTGGGPMIISNIEQIWTAAKKLDIWDAFTDVTTTPFNMNGLEITYTFHQSPGGIGGNFGAVSDSNPRASGEGSEAYPKYISTNRIRWPLQTSSRLTPADLANIFGIDLKDAAAYSYANLQDIHLAFVKVWRSPFRTAVVDFPESIIQIPAFDKYDYYYHDDEGKPISLNDEADQRIDLLVAYAVPIDSSGATLADYSDNWCVGGQAPNPKTISSPQLGLIRGAGIGIKRATNIAGEIQSINTTEGCDDVTQVAPGKNKILANINDTAVTSNLGLTDPNRVKVHGSFPSPDDLINMAPLLALDTDGDDLTPDDRFQLIGQTALPLAYIVVTKNQNALNDADILDIRPFMRTTELTYNERAGVAAANPPLSLANPAVGAYQLQNLVDELDIIPGGDASLDGKIIYADYIQGGLAYGVEGTLLTMCDQTNQKSTDPWGSITTGLSEYLDAQSVLHSPTPFAGFTNSNEYLDEDSTITREALLEYFYRQRQSDVKKWLSDPGVSDNITNYLGFPTQRNVSLFPEWDMPMNGGNYPYVMTDSTTRSAKATWWMWLEGVTSDRPYTYVPGAVPSKVDNNTSLTRLGKRYQQGYGSTTGYDNMEYFTITCSKRFEITLPSWCQDYDVMADYSNCIPFTASIADKSTVGAAGLHISKGPVVSVNGQNKAVFIINTTSTPLPAYGKKGMLGLGDGDGGTSIMDGDGTADRLSSIGERIYQWLSYSVITPQNEQTHYGVDKQETAGNNQHRNLPKIGAAYYPTVGFKIIGFEKNPIFNNLSGGSTLAQTGTYIPRTTTNGVGHDSLTGSMAPVYPQSFIDLS